MTEKFVVLSGNTRRGTIFLVAVFMLVVLSGTCTDRNILVTAAPLRGRRATASPSFRTCPEEDIGVKAYLAQTVFEGKARSRSAIRDGVYNVTFVVQQVYKGGEQGFVHSQVRLQFAEKGVGYAHVCNDDVSNSVVRANIKRGGKYIVFVDKVEQHIFKARGEPVKRSEKNAKAVKDLLCQDCVKPPTLTGLRNVTLKTKEKLKLVCRTKGNPLPTLRWYKDASRIQPSRKIRIHTKRKRSTLVIPRLRPEDAGVYECRAKSVTGEVATISSKVTVNSDTRPENTTTLWPLVGGPCPVDSYCLNGGTCSYYDTVGELVCQCADGYKGQRCENKDVYNRGKCINKSVNVKRCQSRSYICCEENEEESAAAVRSINTSVTRDDFVLPLDQCYRLDSGAERSPSSQIKEIVQAEAL